MTFKINSKFFTVLKSSNSFGDQVLELWEGGKMIFTESFQEGAWENPKKWAIKNAKNPV